MTGPGPAEPNRRPVRSWWGGNADRGDSVRLEAFSDGVLAIAITLLILDVRVGQQPGQSLAAALAHAGPEVGAYAASFLQIGIMWANHHALFRIVDRVDQLLLLANLGLLLFVAFLPLPTRLVAEHTSGDDARTAMLLYGATLTGCALAFNLIWRHAVRRGLLAERVDPRFRRDVDIRYLARTRRLPRRHPARPHPTLAHPDRHRPARAAIPPRPIPETRLAGLITDGAADQSLRRHWLTLHDLGFLTDEPPMRLRSSDTGLQVVASQHMTTP